MLFISANDVKSHVLTYHLCMLYRTTFLSRLFFFLKKNLRTWMSFALTMSPGYAMLREPLLHYHYLQSITLLPAICNTDWQQFKIDSVLRIMFLKVFSKYTVPIDMLLVLIICLIYAVAMQRKNQVQSFVVLHRLFYVLVRIRYMLQGAKRTLKLFVIWQTTWYVYTFRILKI